MVFLCFTPRSLTLTWVQESTEHHLPEGGNSFHSAEQAKLILPKAWSPQGSEGHSTLCTFHWSNQRRDTEPTNESRTFDLTVNKHTYHTVENRHIARSQLKMFHRCTYSGGDVVLGHMLN